MKNKWREFWYCSDGRFNRVSLIKVVIGLPLAPFAAVLLGPPTAAAALVGMFIGDSYCSENEKEEVIIIVFVLVLILWVFFMAITTNQGAS